MAADGTITLATKIDTKGIKNGENTVKNAAERMGEKFSKAGQRIQAALNGGTAQADKLTLSMQKASAQVEEQSQKVENLKAHLAALNSGQEMVTNPEIKGITRDLDTADAKIRKLKAELATMQAAPSWQQDTDKIAQLKSEIDATIKSADVMGERLRNAVDAETQAQIDKTTSTLNKEEIKLNDVKLKAQEAGDALKSSMTGAIPAVNTVTSGIEKFGNRILGLAKRVFVFTLITKALRSVRTFLGNALMSNEDFRNSLNKLKAALLVAFQPIYEVILPALKSLIDWITYTITTLTKLFAALTGRSYTSMVANAKALQEQTDAYKNISSTSSKAAKDMKKTTKEAEKQIAAFDELSILSENKSEDDSDIDTDTDSLTSPDFEGLMNNYDESALGEKIKEFFSNIHNIILTLSAALLVIGIIFIMSGTLTPLGIGLVIAGAVGLAKEITENWDAMPEKMKEFFEQNKAAIAILSAAMLVLGIILCMTGTALPLGIGMIAVGAVGLATELMLGSEELLNEIKEFIIKYKDAIVGIGAAMLVLGVILLFLPGTTMVGVTLMALGAAALYAASTLGGADIMETIKTLMTEHKELIEAIGAAMLVIGAILLFVPGTAMIGVGLLALGAIALYSAQQLGDTEEIKTKLEEFFEKHKKAIVAIGAAMFVIGLILLFVPGATMVGVGLMALGAVALFEAQQLGGADLKEEIKKLLDEHAKLFFDIATAMIVFGIILILVPGMFLVGVALLALGFRLYQYEKQQLSSEESQNAITKFFEENAAMLIAMAAAMVVLGVILIMTGALLAVGISLVFAGIALFSFEMYTIDWESIGQKISEVFNSIMEWLKTWGLLVLGVLLCFTGVGIPLGISLIKKGAEGLEEAQDPVWETISEKISEIFETIKELAETAGLIAIGILLCFTGIGIPLGLSLIKKAFDDEEETGGDEESEESMWETIPEKISEIFEKIKGLAEKAGLIALGIVLCFTGIGIPLGISLIKKALTNGEETEEEESMWKTIPEKISEIFEKIKGLAETAGLIAIGILLCFTGVGIPLGISLIKKALTDEGETEGGESMWETIPEKISEVWENIKRFWNANIAKWFQSETWEDLAGNIGDGLLDGIKSKFETITSYVNKAVEKIKDIISGIGSSISSGVSGLLSGVTGQSDSAAVSSFSASIPGLASGAVLPANQPFLAMVGDQKSGTNIETPLETMIEAFQTALESREQNSSTIVPLVLNGRELGRAVIDTGTAEMKRTKGSGYATKVVY